MLKNEVTHWLFQGNPKRYDLKEKLAPDQSEAWLVTRYATRIQPGDIVWFWRAVERALYGWGHVVGPPTTVPGLHEVRVQVQYRTRFDPSIGLDDVRGNPGLSHLMVLRAPQGTNFSVTPNEAGALVELASRKGFNVPPIAPGVESLAPFVFPSPDAHQWLDRYLTSPLLMTPFLQTVDLVAAIHDRALPASSNTPPFATWLATALTGSRRPGSTPTENRLFAHISDPWEDDEELRDAEVSEETAGRMSGFGTVMSPALAESVDRAVQIAARMAPAGETNEHVDIRTPALVAALLFSDWPSVKHLLARLGLGRTVVELRESFLAEISKVFGEEAAPRWRPYTRLGAADLVVLSYAPDLAEGRDALGIEPDVQAFASVIASDRLTPPLSIGLFGDWGSGKSFFMRKLREQIEELAKSARVPDPASPGKWIENPESDFLPNIVQIEFNAWHYVESNLWASLVTHLFENLRIDTEDPADVLQKRRDTLLNEMNTAAKLRANSEDERNAALKQLDEKRIHLRKLQFERSQQRIRRSFTEVLDALTKQSYEDLLTDDAKAAIEKAKKGNFQQWEQAFDELSRSAKDARSLLGRTGRLLLGLRQLGKYNFIWLGGLVVGALVMSYALPKLLDGDSWKSSLGALAALVSGGAVWLRRGVEKAGRALDFIEAAQSKVNAAIAESVPPPSTAEQEIAEDVRNLENQVQIAETQVQQAAVRAEAAEAALIDINRTASLAHFIEQRAASGDYREQLGILALIRQDFEQISKRMQRMRKSPPALDDPSRIDRIVLYIDDLDRCPAERVFEVLQAIHLLLAFDIFVVVVGVDERWLTRALALARTGLLRRPDGRVTETDKALKSLNIRPGDTARPADFLEKIFQVAFWLEPINPRGFKELLDGMLRPDQVRLSSVESGLAGATTEQSQDNRGRTDIGAGALGAAAGTVAQLGIGNEPEETGDITNAKPEAVAITPKEAEVMQLLAPIVGRSPRTAKRFVNIYRILKAREYVASALNPLLEAESLGGMTLLALVTGNPRGTQALLEAIESAPEEQLVKEFLTWESPPAANNQNNQGLARFKGTLPDAIGCAIAGTANAHFGGLMMRDLQRWLPTVRRFSFRSEIARETSYSNAFSPN